MRENNESLGADVQIDALVWALPDVSLEGQRRLRDLVGCAQSMNDRHREAIATYHLARAIGETGGVNEARRLLERSRRMFGDVGDAIGEVTTALGDMTLDLMTGNPRRSIETGRNALEMLDAQVASGETGNSIETHELRHRLRSNLGLSLAAVGEFVDAIAASDAALVHPGVRKSPVEMAFAMSNRGFLLKEMGKPLEALEWLEQSLTIFDEHELTGRSARSRAVAARCHAMLGHTDTALVLLHAAQAELADVPDTPDHLSINLELARVYSLIGRDREAIELLDLALPRLQTSGMIADRLGAHILAAELAGRAGSPLAREMFLEAREMFLEATRSREGAQCVLALIETGAARPSEVTELLTEAAAVLERAGSAVDRARWRLVTVESSTDGTDPHALLIEANALIASLSVPQLHWRIAFQQGQAELDMGNRNAGRQRLRTAITVLQRQRAAIPGSWIAPADLVGPPAIIDRLRSTVLEHELGDELMLLLDRSGAPSPQTNRDIPDTVDLDQSSIELCILYAESLRADDDRLFAMQERIHELERDLASIGSSSETRLGRTRLIYGQYEDEVFCVVSDSREKRVVRQLCSVTEIRALALEHEVVVRRSDAETVPAKRVELERVEASLLEHLYHTMVEPLSLTRGGGSVLVTPPPGSGELLFEAFRRADSTSGKSIPGFEATTLTVLPSSGW